mmetsp:Transcript_44217/g.71059  ORF Transcript_44217/g.71059 Transcript_44217/m.71059 type:complete len:197 (-) Transcript_44217:114-704(-)|eukprot:jgi/Bigna1/85284/estExt_fgenesh1_pg.C_30146
MAHHLRQALLVRCRTAATTAPVVRAAAMAQPQAPLRFLRWRTNAMITVPRRIFSDQAQAEQVEEEDEFGVVKKRVFARYTQSNHFPDSQIEKPTLWKIIHEKHKEMNEEKPNSPVHIERVGEGLKVTRELWDRYPEPCFWEVTKTKIVARASPRAWGVLTFRGEREQVYDEEKKEMVDRVRKIRGTRKITWKVVEE